MVIVVAIMLKLIVIYTMKTRFKDRLQIILNVLSVLCVDRICTEDHMILLKTASMLFHPFKRFSDLFIIHTIFD